MDITQLKPIIEAMIFVSDRPISETELLLALTESGADKSNIRECLDLIEKECNEEAGRGIGLRQVAGGWQFHTKTECADYLKKLAVPKPVKLSGPALETLAIIAYRQPIVRSEVEKVRGVDSGAVLKTLLDRRLLRIVGRRDEPGQPLLYGTTKEFLEVFNLKALTELPTLKDIEDLMRERRTATDPSTHSVRCALSLPKGSGQEERPADAQTQVPGEDEELTEILGDEENEEDTQIIRRAPLDGEEEEAFKGEKDMEALKDLENSLKNLRRLEKVMFPKEHDPSDEEVLSAGGENAQNLHTAEPQAALSGAQGSKPDEAQRTSADENSPDAPRADDSPFD